MQVNKDRLVERFLRYVKCDSESGAEKAMCDLIAEELRGLGLTVEKDEVGEKCGSDGYNVYASLPGEGEPILFCAHLDTVAPGKGVQPVIKDGVIRSSGDTVLGGDDKSGVAAVLEAIETTLEANAAHRPVEVLFTICEEVGLLGSKHADYGRIKSKEAVVLDSGDPAGVVNRAPAHVRLHIEVQGKSAHAGVSPDKGVHALKAAAAAIDRIPCGFVGDQTVMNVANFASPGKSNVVPDKATFDMEIRCFEENLLQQQLRETEQAISEACKEYGAAYTMDVERSNDALYVPEDTPLVQKLMEALKNQGVDAKLERTYGGSDTTWIFAHGIDALNMGTGMQDVHSTSEYIAISDMVITANVVLGMMGA